MKPIKFDLPLSGTRVGTLEQLKNNLSAEILEPFYSGKLERWLRVRNLIEEANTVKALLNDETEREMKILENLCRLFGDETNENSLQEAIVEYKQLRYLEQDEDEELLKAEFAKKEEEYQQEIKRLKSLRIDQFIANYDGTAEDAYSGPT